MAGGYVLLSKARLLLEYIDIQKQKEVNKSNETYITTLKRDDNQRLDINSLDERCHFIALTTKW